MKARLNDLLAKASIIQYYPIFSLYNVTCRHDQLKFHVEIHFSNEYNSRET